MNISKNKLCKVSIVSIAFLQFIKPFITIDISLITFLLGVLLFFLSFPTMGKSFRKTAAVFFVLGIILLTLTNTPYQILINGTNSMLNIIAILVVMQLFIIPIKTGRYNESIEYFLFNRIKSKSVLYLFTLGTTHIFSSFLLFGTIPVILSLMGDAINERVSNYKQFVSTALSRGYALVILWAPGAINILLVMQAVDVKWAEIFLPGLFLSLLGLATSFFLERKHNFMDENQFKREINSSPNQMLPQEARRKIRDIFLVVLALIIITLLLEKMNFASSTNRILIAGVIVFLVWSMKYRKSHDIKNNILEYWDKEVSKNLDLAGLFVAVGIFAEAIGSIGIIDTLELLLLTYGNNIQVYILFLVPLTIILCSIIGIHPFITIVMTGKLLGSLTLSFSKVSLALALGIGGSISYVVSPFAGIVLTLAKYTDSTPGQISLKWNAKFSIVYLVEASIFIYLYNYLFLN